MRQNVFAPAYYPMVSTEPPDPVTDDAPQQILTSGPDSPWPAPARFRESPARLLWPRL